MISFENCHDIYVFFDQKNKNLAAVKYAMCTYDITDGI